MRPLVQVSAPRRERAIRAARWLGQHPVQRLLRMEIEGVEHVPSTGPVLLVANHSAFLDGPVLFAAAPREGRFLVKSELYRGPLARALSWLDQVPVNRGRADRTALRAARSALTQGRLVAVFPEGTRGSGDVSAVRDGVGWLLAHTQVPVVPVALFGTLRSERKQTGLCVVFGAPILVPVTGDPSARSTQAAVAEHLRVVLAQHVVSSRLSAGPRTSRQVAA